MTGKVLFPSGPALALKFGYHEENLRQLETSLGVRVAARGNEVSVKGPKAAVGTAVRVLERLRDAAGIVTPETIRDLAGGRGHVASAARPGGSADLSIRTPRQIVQPRGEHQAEYVRAIRSCDVVFGVGPAGTGKTYLAVGCALQAYASQIADRIILVRPVVEAGERLGFLPGDVQEKVNPYMRPLYDALSDMLEPATLRRLLQQETSEIAPLAYMRGRTLNKAFIILDEAQNTTSEQMKMFLTRLGFGSQAVVTGDITQVDLPTGRVSGLIEVRGILKDVPGIRFIHFSEEDVVRHELVQRIVRAYEAYQGPPAEPGA